jgi:SAM-dependent methyltransferase
MRTDGRILSHGAPSDPHQAPAQAATCREIEQELRGFALGRFLLENRGLNGFWTSYIVNHPHRVATGEHNSLKQPLSELERFILERAPICLATQERFVNFQRVTQALCRTGMRLASVPCGMMDDLLSLNYRGLSNIELTGIDLDANSLELAKSGAASSGLPFQVAFELRDAWQLGATERWDLITSNGLNIYVADDAACTSLYSSFYSALRPGGALVTSFITPPTTWQPHSTADLERQRVVFAEAIKAKWQCTRSEEITRAQLSEAGFRVTELVYDSQRMFPTVVAKKR